jgi:hypothetical protein
MKTLPTFLKRNRRYKSSQVNLSEMKTKTCNNKTINNNNHSLLRRQTLIFASSAKYAKLILSSINVVMCAAAYLALSE